MSTKDSNLSAESIKQSREERLESCLIRLLNTRELNFLDDMEEETREAVREALCVIEDSSTPQQWNLTALPKRMKYKQVP